MARVTVTSRTVEWSDFENPHRPEWDYGDLRFTFDRSRYEDELRSLNLTPGPSP